MSTFGDEQVEFVRIFQPLLHLLRALVLAISPLSLRPSVYFRTQVTPIERALFLPVPARLYGSFSQTVR